MSKRECWLPVVGYPNYLVSNYGCVLRLAYLDVKGRTWKKRELKATNADTELMKDGKRARQPIARLVLMAFVGPPPSPKKNLARHLDDDRTNNFVENLAWGDHKENAEDARKNGLLLPAPEDRRKSPEYREACRQRMLGSTLNCGRKHTAEFAELQRLKHLGRKDSEAARQRKSQSAKAAWARRKAQPHAY